MTYYLDENALDDIATGSSILGSGGGGNPYHGLLIGREAIRQHGQVTVVDLNEVDDSARVIFLAGIGAPGVLIEKLHRSADILVALDTLEEHLGYHFTHVASIEAGGINGLMPIAAAAERGLPLIDADGMGRAFPLLELCIPTLYGATTTPMSIVDEHGNRLVVCTPTNPWAEKICRPVVVASGCVMSMALFPMSGQMAKQSLVPGTLTATAHLGRVLREARAAGESPVMAVANSQGGVLLFEGMVSAVERRNEMGWTSGEARITGSGQFQGSQFTVRFQNENLAAIRDGEVVATVPDLIMVLVADSGEPVPAEDIRYGYRVAVIGMPCDSRWRSEAGLALAGPRQFGYDHDFRPVEQATAGT